MAATDMTWIKSLRPPCKVDKTMNSSGAMSGEDSPTQPKTTLSKFILSEESLYTKAELLSSIQRNIISLFQRKGSMQANISELHGEVKSLLATEAGQFLGQFYEERLLKKGMWLLREELRDLEMYNLLLSVADCWNYFYTETLPWLQAIMIDVHTKNHTIRQATLLAFRDEMLLKTPIKAALKAYTDRSLLRQQNGRGDNEQDDVKAALVQMFLVLLSVNRVPDRKYRKLEKLAAMLITPLVTLSGIFYDGCLNQTRSVGLHKTPNNKRFHSAGDLLETCSDKEVPDEQPTHGRARRPRHLHVPRHQPRHLSLRLSPLLTVEEASIRPPTDSFADAADSQSHV